MPLILRVNKLKIVQWWVDASYAMHPDFWSHTGASMSLGWGSVTSMSKRQNLYSIISTEAELIGADDVILAFLCSIYFI